MDVKTTEVEKVNKIGRLVGQAQHQPVSPEIVGGTVEELEREIDRLQKQNENQAQTIRALTETVGRLEGRARVLEVLRRDRSDLEKIIAGMTTNFYEIRNQIQLINVSNQHHECQLFPIDYLTLLRKFSVVVNENNRLRSKYERLRVRFARLQERREVLPPQNPVICPVDPPLPTLTANVPREAVGVHAAPNVRIAGGE